MPTCKRGKRSRIPRGAAAAAANTSKVSRRGGKVSEKNEREAENGCGT